MFRIFQYTYIVCEHLSGTWAGDSFINYRVSADPGFTGTLAIKSSVLSALTSIVPLSSQRPRRPPSSLGKMSKAVQVAEIQSLYQSALSLDRDGASANVQTAVSKWFALAPPAIFPVLLFIDAPFGRFTPKQQSSWLLVDGEYVSDSLRNPLTRTCTQASSRGYSWSSSLSRDSHTRSCTRRCP